ncbi:MAG: hypothetical protein ACI8PD_002176 [Nitrospinales bacterium]|jgi:hypothetical protein
MNYQMALSYLENGFSLIPMYYRSSIPCDAPLRLNTLSGAQCWRVFEDRMPSLSELRFWYKHSGSLNIGAALGRASGNLAVMEFRTAKEICQWREVLGELASYMDQRGHLRRMLRFAPVKMAIFDAVSHVNRF